jgi:uncharacterized protein YjbI with pentapeptide repeats
MAKPPSSTAKNRKPAIAADPAPDPAAEPPVAFDAEGLKRVQDIIKNARATWFALLGALVFASITLASVKDVSFFVNTVETKLPLVGISVPVTSFFWAGSLLIAAIYAYFHLYLELLWQALGDFPARDKDKVRLADRIEPWIVADAALRWRDWLRGNKVEDKSSRDRAMPWISGFVAIGLVWFFGLIVIGWFWWRSMPAHDPLLTLFLGVVLCVTIFIFGTSFACAWSNLKFDNHESRRTIYWQWSVPLVLFAILVVTFVRTGKSPPLDADQYVSEENPLIFGETLCAWQVAKEQKINSSVNTTTPVPALQCWRHSDLFTAVLRPAPANLREVVFTEKPKDWQGKEIAETEFRVRWCKERGELKCANPLSLENRKFDDGTAEKEFQAAWQERWEALLAQMPKLDMRAVDLRGADLSSAQLEGANLSSALLQGADLNNARLEGSNLGGALLEGADLTGAILEGANLSSARLDSAYLVDAWLECAVLSFARLQGAKLYGARLMGADLSDAGLEGARLKFAQLQGANLSGARLEGADLQVARLFGKEGERLNLASANLRAANFEVTALRFAEVNADIMAQARNFQTSFGDASVKLPEGRQPPCQWGSGILPDNVYFGRWEGWLLEIRYDTFDLQTDEYPAIFPDPECIPRRPPR